MKIKINRGTVLFIIFLAVICVSLFGGADVTLSDNGDFARVIRLSSIYKDGGVLKLSCDTKDTLAALSQILFDGTGIETYPSSQLIFTRLSAAASLVLNVITGTAHNTYHIGILGLMYTVMYAAALAFFVTRFRFGKRWQGVVFSALCAVVCLDIGYTSYFNSLYGEGLSHIALVFVVGFIVDAFFSEQSVKKVIFAYAWIIMYGTAKSFNIPCALIFALVYLLSLGRGKRKIYVSAIVSGVISVAVLAASFVAVPDWIGRETNYNSVFFGILKNEPNTDALSDLGLDENLAELWGTNQYVSNIEEIRESYDVSAVDELSYLDLVMYYAKNPLDMILKLPHILKFTGAVRNIFFLDMDFMSDWHRLSIWSHIRENIGFDGVILNVSVIAAFFVMFFRKKERIFRGCLLLLSLLYALVMPYVANGEADLAKHMLMWAEFVDIIFICLVYAVLSGGRREYIAGAVLGVCILAGALSQNVLLRPKVHQLGGYSWYVIDEDEGAVTLLMCDALAERAYDENGAGFLESDVYAWLNGEFLDSFSPEDRSRVLNCERFEVLSRDETANAERGECDFYCLPYPEFCADGYDSAYAYTVEGAVMLPSVSDIAAASGYNISCGDDFWLSTAYFGNSAKARFVAADGMVYFDDKSEEKAIRPLVKIKKQ